MALAISFSNFYPSPIIFFQKHFVKKHYCFLGTSEDPCKKVRLRYKKPNLKSNYFYFPVYDSGTVFSPAVLDITDDDLRARFMQVRKGMF
jgi:hypothetical protein